VKMISYETYKSLHIFFILCFFSSMGFVSYSSQLLQKKLGKWMVGLASFLIMVAGMGLIARLGFKHDQAFPLWIKLKIGNWIAINVLFVCLFKLKTIELKAIITSIILILAWIGIWLAINKPV
ncbi:MAG: hypothetical protein Q7U04_00845, partial [Bacteriovorax sp.]|nr:hypothetical protein [Bacteriovorax sp.]